MILNTISQAFAFPTLMNLPTIDDVIIEYCGDINMFFTCWVAVLSFCTINITELSIIK